jgi:hypothetical protein
VQADLFEEKLKLFFNDKKIKWKFKKYLKKQKIDSLIYLGGKFSTKENKN